MKIGLVGEAPSDTQAIRNLLNKNFPHPAYEYFVMVNNIHGSQLDNQKTKRLVRKEYESENPDIVIFIRDLDGTLTNNSTLPIRKSYFTSFNRVVDKKGLFLLNIFEIEALIISDIKVLDRIFSCKIIYDEDPMEIQNPKEELKRRCKQFTEARNPEIFENLDFEVVRLKCRYFFDFVSRFERMIKAIQVLHR